MKNKTLTVSSVFVLVFAVALAALLCTAPMLVELFGEIRAFSQLVLDCILYTFYLCSLPAAIALYGLWQLLRNIQKEQIFVLENCRLLGMISWCSLTVTILTLAACYHYLPFGLVSVAMLFIFLIVRVVRSCMLNGTALKEENSLTI
ncbi:MAG: DUF2975 domain-containing protein [Ruminococcaceae bacterium]|nr:DUF2975 domain-containing protein [Oscillospiraceae bacterium]